LTEPSPRLAALMAQADADIEMVLAGSRKPLLAYSGGKDALATAVMLERHGVVPGVCETSFYYDAQDVDIRATANARNWDVTFVQTRDDAWLSKHPEYIFTNDSKLRGKSFAERQQRSVAMFADQHGHDLVVFGRRTQENSVPSMIYDRKGIKQFHPLRSWKHEDVWELLEVAGIPVPWIYTSIAGRVNPVNGPFYALPSRKAGSVEAAWDIVLAMQPDLIKWRTS
jgi:3'-phosphoadenosine 5'-phosphosulfate sulfotransferase (PAPS reductase)/FAD synthetase